MNVQINPLAPQAQLREGEQAASRSRTRTYAIGGLALAVVLGGFWFFTHGDENAKPRRNLAAPVKVAPVEQHDMAVIERTIGTVLANSTVSVNARVQGQLVKAFFKEGQMVKTGDLLFQIDPRPYQAAYDNAMASLATAKAKYDRYVRLKSQNAISPQDVDDAQAAYLEAKATAEAARLNLEFTTIRSPVNGKTGPMLIQPGNMVAASTASTSATPLVTINEIQPVKISLALPQSDLPRIQRQARAGGLNITMNLHDAGGDRDLSAKVDFISNAVAGTTGTIELRSTYPNDDLALVPGQLVDVVVALDRIPNAILVPREAVNTGADGQYVYAVKDGTAQQIPVKVQFDDGTNSAVIGKLAKGDEVIVDGQLRVIPGAKVSVTHAGKQEHSATQSGATRTSGRRKHVAANEG
ncbi:MAG TPA: efflux RND transporter periplasmic adaptor subunit [Rhizomicrobium sp.]|jgi:multidrug efflux system membrane fusion protein|nr:efflux RND transporter periplasmic adaptor subunit [Rhizomicrobium sp.]